MTEAPYPGNEDHRGPVGRIFDLMFLDGTTPEYCLPVLDEALEREILAAMDPTVYDPPFDTGSIGRSRAFSPGISVQPSVSMRLHLPPTLKALVQFADTPRPITSTGLPTLSVTAGRTVRPDQATTPVHAGAPGRDSA
jgi:hypothetical protein